MKVAILGYGNVGGGAYDIIAKYGCGLTVKRVLARSVRPGMEGIITTDFQDILNDPEIELVAEAIGGLHPAYEYAMASLSAGKHFVSANKELISRYYTELSSMAREKGVQLRFAPSAGGGIPWLPNLIRAKRCDSISEISGILNGTTNYILYNMTEHGLPFDEVLREAQRLGFAEADPTADIDGLDAQRKCAISASLAFDAAMAEDSVQVFGIRRITDKDIANFKSMGRVCRLLVRAKKTDKGVCAYVEPTLLPLSAPESTVAMSGNMVTLTGESIGRLTFAGQGAGRAPTGSSMVQDMIDIMEGCGGFSPACMTAAADNSLEAHHYYVRTSAPVKEITQLGGRMNGEYYITDELTVAEMHRAAEAILQTDADAFFAGIA